MERTGMKQRQAIIRFFCIIGLLQILVIGVQATPISFGETVTGIISAPSQMNDYTFSATAGDTIYTRMRSNWSDGARIILRYPNGTESARATGGYFTDLTKTLPLNGTYTLLAGDYDGNNLGTYDLYLQRTNNAGRAEPIAFGETKTGSITKPAQLNNYTFSATKGDTLYTRMRSNWSDGAHIRLYAPNGTEIATATGGYFTATTKTLPLNGTYTLLAGDYDGNNLGTYDLYLQRTNNPGRAEPIAFGETKTGSITKPAQLNNYTFSATKGDTLYTRMRSGWSDGAHIRLYAPNGTEIATATGGYFTDITKTLPLNGTYTLLAGDYDGNNLGTYDLYLQRTNNAGRAEPIAFGETKTGSITKPAQLNNYTFSATKGDTLYTRMRSNWSDGAHIRLYAPNGTEIATATGGYFTAITKTLPLNGTYTLLAGDYDGNNLGTYDLYLQRTNNAGRAEPIVSTETKTGYITKPAQLDNYTFFATEDSTAYIRMSSSWSDGAHIRLYAPNGTEIATATGGYFTDLTKTLPLNGTYTLLVGDYDGNNIGTYQLYIIISGIPPSITVTSPNGGESWVNGTSHAITWTSFGDVGSYVKIEVLKAGVVVQNLSSSTPNNGSFSWTIGLSPGTDYKIRITSTTNAGITDTSDGNFTIIEGNPGSMTVTSPNGGEIWSQNTTHPITWTYTGSTGSAVKIELLKNGIFYQLLKSNTSMGSAGSGSFPWTISANTKPGAEYKVRVQT